MLALLTKRGRPVCYGAFTDPLGLLYRVDRRSLAISRDLRLLLSYATAAPELIISRFGCPRASAHLRGAGTCPIRPVGFIGLLVGYDP